MASTTAERGARLADVARLAGVSQGTVSNVFNRPQLVREEVRERVKAAARALGYAGPDLKGRLLRGGKFNAIGVATAGPLSYFFEDLFARELMVGIAEACDAHGGGLALVSAASDETLAWNIRSALVDGFVLLCIESGERLVELTRERQLPFVALGLSRPDESISAIGIDNFGGARLAAEHLLALGHRRFAVLALQFADGHSGRVSLNEVESATYSTTRDRARGYVAALASHGIEAAQVPIFETRNDEEAVAQALEELWQEEPPTALLAMSDKVAMAAIKWLGRRGIRVPQDVSIVGFDGVPEAAASIPPLTTVTQPIAEMGRRAVAAILQPPAGVVRKQLEVSLTVRGSTAPPRAG